MEKKCTYVYTKYLHAYIFSDMWVRLFLQILHNWVCKIKVERKQRKNNNLLSFELNS